MDPLVHEELKTKHQELEKKHQDTLAKATSYFEKLTEKKAEQTKLKHDLADLNQKLLLSQSAEKEAQSKQQQLQQEVQQSLTQLQELKQQLHQLQVKDQQTISQLEKTVEDLKEELALAIRASASVGAVAASAVSDGSSGKSKASILAASALPTDVTTTANLNQSSAPAFSVNSQFPPVAASSVVTFVPASMGNADFGADNENSGDKRSSESDLVGAKQAKRVFFCLIVLLPFPPSSLVTLIFFSQPKNVSFEAAPQIFTIPSGSSDPVSNCRTTAHVLRVSGFPLGVTMDGDVAKALFPNQVCRVSIFV